MDGREWIKLLDLLAADKTEIVMSTRKQIDTVNPIRINEDTVIETKRFVKYLGIILVQDCLGSGSSCYRRNYPN